MARCFLHVARWPEELREDVQLALAYYAVLPATVAQIAQVDHLDVARCAASSVHLRPMRGVSRFWKEQSCTAPNFAASLECISNPGIGCRRWRTRGWT